MLSEILFATSVVVTPVCQWDHPGANRFTGDVSSAVHNYIDIPKNIRDKLEKRLNSKKYDDVVEITKDNIAGKDEYIDLRDMHFGKNLVCQSVNRDKWKTDSKERGLIYCEESHCIIVPTVCGNISRVTRLKNTGGILPGAARVDNISVIDSAIPLIISMPSSLPVDSFQYRSTETRRGVPPYEIIPYYQDQPKWCFCIPAIVPVTPEPASVITMIIGLLAIVVLKYRKFISAR